MRYILLILLIINIKQISFSQKVFFNNEKPRLTKEGKIVDAHDGRVIQFGKKYYWYGTQYGNTNGFTEANTYVCYSSDNLNDWQFEGALLPNKPKGVYYRPHVVFNKKMGKYILWYNWNPKLWDGQFGVAESTTPIGPFTIINDNVPVRNSALGVGDLGVFIDDDNTAYLSYNTIKGHKVSVEKLDENYTASTQEGSVFIAEHCEAGSMFKRNGLYYLMTDYTCCFCTQGSGAKVFTATNPLGPYTFRQNINRYAGTPTLFLNDGIVHDNQFETLQAKQKDALELHFNTAKPLSKLTIHQFTGNRNGQCGEVNNPILHAPILTYDFTINYFKNGQWQVLNTQKPKITTASQQNIYDFSFSPIQAERVKIEPVYQDTLSPLHIAELKINGLSTGFSVFKTNNQEGKPIIPAQQTYVMALMTPKGTQYIWMGDLWGSSSEGIKGSDYQFWSAPLQFYPNGLIKQIGWVNGWSSQ